MPYLFYSKTNKWFFNHIPKTGGTSVSRQLHAAWQSHKYNVDALYLDLKEYHNPAVQLIQNYHELEGLAPVCLVRNPWARCLSLYTFNLANTTNEKNFNKEWAIGIHTRLTREGFKNAWMPNGFFRDEDNMQNGINHNPGRTWKENDPQTSWLTPTTKAFRLETGLEAMYATMKVPYTEKIANTSQHYAYKLYYDSELQAEISSLYAKDIAKFQYTFG